MYVMLAPLNVSTMTLTTASNAHKHVGAVLKNVEEWQNRPKDHLPPFLSKL
jgi:hypothetical protein